MLGVHSAPALEARLSQALVEALTEAAPGDLRGEFAPESRIPKSLEGRVRPSAVRE